jgi:hypothetical protein
MNGRPITNVHGLVALYLLTDWIRLRREGTQAGAGWFLRHGVLAGICRENRGVTFALLRIGACLQCGEELPLTSSGDHIVARDAGGPDGAQNYMPLCKGCNSSKGNNDLLWWWTARKGRSVLELPVEALTAYARLTWAQYLRTGRDRKPIEPGLAHAVCELLDELPTNEHRKAVWDKMRWVAGA